MLAKQGVATLTRSSVFYDALGNMDDLHHSAQQLKSAFLKAGKNADTLIVSYEGFSGSLRKGYRDVGDLAKLLSIATEGYETSVIVYFRRQDAFIQTAYTQLIHEGETLTFSDYVNSLRDDDFNWSLVAQAYATQLGPDHLISEFYDKDLIDGPGLLADFFNKAGISPMPQIPERSQNINVSLKGASLEFLRLSNQVLSHDDSHLMRKLLQSNKDAPQQSAGLLSSAQSQKLQKRYLESNRELSHQFISNGENRDFINQPWTGNTEEPQAITVQEFTQISAPLLVDLAKRLQTLEKRYKGVESIRRVFKSDTD